MASQVSREQPAAAEAVHKRKEDESFAHEEDAKRAKTQGGMFIFSH